MFTVAAANDGAEADYGGIGGFAADFFADDEDDSAEVASPVAPVASRNDPETADADATVASTTIKPKGKKNKKKNAEEEGIMYEILSGILNYFS